MDLQFGATFGVLVVVTCGLNRDDHDQSEQSGSMELT